MYMSIMRATMIWGNWLSTAEWELTPAPAPQLDDVQHNQQGIRDIPKNVAMTIGTMVFGDIPWQWEPRIWLGDIPWICYLLVNFYITMENHHHVSWRNQALELSFIPWNMGKSKHGTSHRDQIETQSYGCGWNLWDLWNTFPDAYPLVI